MTKYRLDLRNGGNGFHSRGVLLGLILSLIIVALAGCVVSDGHEDPSPTYVAQILSDEAADGDIQLTPPATFTISSALDTGNVLAGVDPATGDEFRGFLDFPLRGSHGVPFDAAIESATLEIYISDMRLPSADTILPFVFDLVAFQPPLLIVDDFDRIIRPPLLTMPFDFYPSDDGAIVVIDVTALMNEAQFQGLPDFQLRILLDYSATSGLIEIDDGDLETAPLLTITYF